MLFHIMENIYLNNLYKTIYHRRIYIRKESHMKQIYILKGIMSSSALLQYDENTKEALDKIDLLYFQKYIL